MYYMLKSYVNICLIYISNRSYLHHVYVQYVIYTCDQKQNVRFELSNKKRYSVIKPILAPHFLYFITPFTRNKIMWIII